MDTAFAVKIGEFEGPLDLLLTLIEERKMLVSDVSLSAVTDDFLKFIEAEKTFPTKEAAHFILVAAMLLLLKSRSLLPVLALTDEEEGDIKDLEFRLTLYQAFREVARELGRYSERMYFGDGSREWNPVFTPSGDLSLESIERSLEAVLQNAPQKTVAPEIAIQKTISLEEMMQRLSERIEKALTVTFSDFAGSATDRRELVVGFLAVLELVKRGLLMASQEALFGDITMRYGGVAKAPRYE